MKKFKTLAAGMIIVLGISMLAACGCTTGDNGNTGNGSTTNTESTENRVPGTQNGSVNNTTENRVEDTTMVDDTTNNGENGVGGAIGDVVDGVGEAGKDVIDGVENGVDDLTGNDQNNTENNNTNRVRR